MSDVTADAPEVTEVPTGRPDVSQFEAVARRELDFSVVRFEDPEGKRHGFLHGNGILSAPQGNVPDDVDEEFLYFGAVLRVVKRLSPTEWQVKSVLLEEGSSVGAVLEEFDRSVAAGLADKVSNDIIDLSSHE